MDGTVQPHCHNLVGSLQARFGSPLALQNGEFDVHRGFKSIAVQPAIALNRVCVSQIQQCSRFAAGRYTVVPSPISLKSILPPQKPESPVGGAPPPEMARPRCTRAEAKRDRKLLQMRRPFLA